MDNLPPPQPRYKHLRKYVLAAAALAATAQQHEAVAVDECPFDDENAQNVKWFGLGKST